MDWIKVDSKIMMAKIIKYQKWQKLRKNSKGVTICVLFQEYVDIFLCGALDSALLQMNITDAPGGLNWEKLNETSCTLQPDGCLNRNLSCTWDNVGTGNDYTADTSGIYRLSVTYNNGCFSRFYFNVFKNELDFYNTNSFRKA